MKPIKHILSFLVLLILQLSFTNSFASVYSNKVFNVSRFELSDESNTVYSKPALEENYIFETSFLEDVSCRSVSFYGGYADLVESWKVLQNRPKLRLKTDALESVSNLLNNPSRTKLGLTDEVIGNIHASRLDDGSFKAIVDDLDALGKKIADKPDVEFENFNSLLGKLNDNNTQNSQAAQWIIQDITENVDDFNGKKWKFEATVTNSDGNAAFIDAASNEVPPKRIEYKWLTNATVGKDDFIREFIKRDLFNATDLNKIEWRIKGQKLTKEKVVEYLNSTEGTKALEDLLINQNTSNKIKQWFSMSNLDESITSKHIQSFVDNYFSQIFK